MFYTLITFHVLVCIALIIVVLLQSSKGEGLAGTAFGGGGGGLGGAVFGGRGAGTFLSKATTILAVLFMVNSIGLAFMSSNRSGNLATQEGGQESVITREAQRMRDEAMQQQQQQQPQSSDSLLNLDFQQITPEEGQGTETQPAPTPNEGGGQ